MLVWLNNGGRETYLKELMRHEGRQDDSEGGVCGVCQCAVNIGGESTYLYKCLDCMGLSLSCASCMVSSHSHNPLHIIQVRRV